MRRGEHAIKPVCSKANTRYRDRLLGHRQADRDVYAINTSSALENDQLDQPHDLLHFSLSLPSLQLLTLAVTPHDFRLRSA